MANEVGHQEVKTALTQGQLIDVREEWEYEDGHVPGAVNIPLGQLPDRLSELRREVIVTVICQSGGRSMRAADFLVANGIEAVSVAGGTGSWIAAGQSVNHGSRP
jgi:rhodanese-related sulfurtransferase